MTARRSELENVLAPIGPARSKAPTPPATRRRCFCASESYFSRSLVLIRGYLGDRIEGHHISLPSPSSTVRCRGSADILREQSREVGPAQERHSSARPDEDGRARSSSRSTLPARGGVIDTIARMTSSRCKVKIDPCRLQAFRLRSPEFTHAVDKRRVYTVLHGRLLAADRLARIGRRNGTESRSLGPFHCTRKDHYYRGRGRLLIEVYNTQKRNHVHSCGCFNVFWRDLLREHVREHPRD